MTELHESGGSGCAILSFWEHRSRLMGRIGLKALISCNYAVDIKTDTLIETHKTQISVNDLLFYISEGHSGHASL